MADATSDPLAIDFAALRTLRMVHAQGSFSRAAEHLGVNQSTVSYTIDRLRRTFGDPLFVRQGPRVVPTERCEEIVGTTTPMMDEFLLLAEPREFRPAEARPTVAVSCNFYERASVLPPLMARLRRDAPGLKVTVLSSAVRGKEQLDRGEAELLIGPVIIEHNDFYRRRLIRDHYVCVVGAQNPLAGATLDIETYLAAPHVVVTYGGTWRSRYLLEIEAQSLSLNTAMEVPSPAGLAELLRETDLIATVPTVTAATFGQGVRILPCPFPSRVDIDLYWTTRTHRSPMHRWLRSQTAEVAGAVASRMGGLQAT